MSKHTPGPWRTDPSYFIYVWGPNHGMVADLPRSDEDTYLARMRGVGRGATEEEQKANAYLIAAAPELLESLDAIVHWHDADGRIDETWWVAARAAIAKAKATT